MNGKTRPIKMHSTLTIHDEWRIFFYHFILDGRLNAKEQASNRVSVCVVHAKCVFLVNVVPSLKFSSKRQ